MVQAIQNTETAPATTEPTTPVPATTPKPTTKPKATPAPKKPAGKPAKATPAKKAVANGSAWVLRKAQIAVLSALNKAGRPLNRSQIAEKGKTDAAFLSTWIGSSDLAVRIANEKKRGVKGLLTLKYVRDEQPESGPVEYVITAAGKAALAKATV
jgi:hypothetical protein